MSMGLQGPETRSVLLWPPSHPLFQVPQYLYLSVLANSNLIGLPF